ncbi:MAG: CvpA family protein [Firmicutes bacterium]|nr:CvpA family protein [Bacillota bacterium]
MSGRWIDIVLLVFIIMGMNRGFRRGLIQEVFGIIGSVLAVILAYRFNNELSLLILEHYSLADWQAQIIAFVTLALGISLLAALFGFIWSRLIKRTPFSIVDNIAGAGFCVTKVLVVFVLAVIILSSLGLPVIDSILEESAASQQVISLTPWMVENLEGIWPNDWPKPGWLFSLDGA